MRMTTSSLLRSLLCAGALFTATAATAITLTLKITQDELQYIRGFGAAGCAGAMCPIQDTTYAAKIYGPNSAAGLNIIRMEMSPNLVGDINDGWDTPYDWHGSLGIVKAAKRLGAIVYACPWSPPGVYKTNGSPKGGNTEDENAVQGRLREDCYPKLFPWFNTFLNYMHNNNCDVDVVSIQNEPDWWVNYSGCLYEPDDLRRLVHDYGARLDKKRFGVKLMMAEALGYTAKYYTPTLNDPEALKYIDMAGGHLYGHAPLDYMKKTCDEAVPKGVECWMTEHSYDPRSEGDNPVWDLPTWDNQLGFANEVNEVIQAGGSAYVYWYMEAKWGFLGTGEQTETPGNGKGQILDRAYIISHFAKHLIGSTRLKTQFSLTQKTQAVVETSAFIKGDSIIVVAINSKDLDYDLDINSAYKLKGGRRIISTEGNLCKGEVNDLPEAKNIFRMQLPRKSIITYKFGIDWEAMGIDQPKQAPATREGQWYNLAGQKVSRPTKGVFIKDGKKYSF